MISWHRFKTIKERIHHAFADPESADKDPWWPISNLVDDYNANREKWVVGAFKVILDEAMSNFQPRTTKLSLLPFLSFVFRKPKPLGTEYKVAACAFSGILLYLEIQKGAVPMRKLPFTSQVGVTAACSLRLLLGAAHSGQATKERKLLKEEGRRHLVIADSWFGSVKLAEACKLLRKAGPGETAIFDGHLLADKTAPVQGHEIIAAVKTNSGWFPKKQIEDKMSKWPSGSYLVMETTAPRTAVKLVAVGYKYNARKVLCFVLTKDAASTIPGSPYKAKYPDQYGNVRERLVERPEAVGAYFDRSNAIDNHNHLRQHLLGLEKYWKTPNPWARNCFSIVGMTAIDCMLALRHRLPGLYEKLTVEEFADRLAYDCYYNGFQRRVVGSGQDDIVADGLLADDQQQQDITARLWNPPQVQNMSINICGTAIPSPITLDGSAFSFGQRSARPEYHDCVSYRGRDINGNASKRRCSICGLDTRMECSHPKCRSQCTWFGGKQYFGTMVCGPRSKPRSDISKQNVTNNTKTCIEIHREQCI
jgi:hypothetical protein